MLSALAIAGKDLRLMLLRGTAFTQALLLGVLLIVLFSLSQEGLTPPSPLAAGTLFWLASAFCQVLVFTALFALEEENGQRLGLLLAPVPSQAVWLGKALAGGALLLVLQAFLLLGSVIFLGQAPGPHWLGSLPILLAADVGITASGALIGALAQGRTGRESLCSIVLFPLLLPLFLAGIHGWAAAFSPEAVEGLGSWTGVALAFDAIFLAAGMVLFPFVYDGE